ncbi:MAG TPA: GNAT family N-acetyltransferase [Gemmatimonadales bacterium]|nr:GNAT family N-acetyltransferase [Gemmatimonadales bacterium]
MRVRRAGLEDLALLVPLYDGYRQFYRQPSDPELAERFLRERLTRGDSVIFLAEDETGALGFTQLYPIFSSISAAPAWVLNDLFVSPAARRSGAGRALLERTRQHGLETGACWLSLSTGRENREAQALYEKLGWVRDTEYYHYELPLSP